MNDDLATNTAQPTQDPQPVSTPQPSPLDILENLLKDAKGKPKGDGLPGADADTKSAEEAAKAEAEKQQVEAERLQLIESKRLEDEQMLRDQLAQMGELKETPQYQARVQQEEDKQQAAQQTVDEQTGFEIVQLDHKKI